MGLIVNAVKWGVKLGVPGSAVYVAHYHNLFGSANDAQKGLEQLKKTSNDLVPKEVMENVPDVNLSEFKDMIPAVEFNFSTDARSLWNKGVFATIGAMANAPTYVKGYTQDVIKYVNEQMR